MLIVTYKLPGGKEYDKVFHFSSVAKPPLQIVVHIEELTATVVKPQELIAQAVRITADSNELDIIRTNFSNIPMSKHHAVTWCEPWVTFILENFHW